MRPMKITSSGEVCLLMTSRGHVKEVAWLAKLRSFTARITHLSQSVPELYRAAFSTLHYFLCNGRSFATWLS